MNPKAGQPSLGISCSDNLPANNSVASDKTAAPWPVAPTPLIPAPTSSNSWMVKSRILSTISLTPLFRSPLWVRRDASAHRVDHRGALAYFAPCEARLDGQSHYVPSQGQGIGAGGKGSGVEGVGFIGEQPQPPLTLSNSAAVKARVVWVVIADSPSRFRTHAPQCSGSAAMIS